MASVRALRCLAFVFSCFCLSACAGIFQFDLPETAATYQLSSPGELRVGMAERDITPDHSMQLAGFGLNRKSRGVLTPLKVRAMVMQVGAAKIAIVGIDSLGLNREDVDWIKAGIWGFANGNVFLCASHTHSAPDLIGLWGFYFITSGREKGYLSLIRQQVRAAVLEAESQLEPATLRRGVGRIPAHGVAHNSNRAGIFDRRLTVLQAIRADGSSIGAMLHFGCHPEVLRRRNEWITSDFVGELCDRWYGAGLGQAVFVNGALGAMVTPAKYNTDGLAEMGQALFDVAESSLSTAEEVPVHDIEVRRRDVYMPMHSQILNFTRLTMVVPREVYDGCLCTTVGYLRVGDFEACCVPGEIEPGLAARIYAKSGKPNLVLFGLCDDEVGYLLGAQEARDPEFRYERSMSPGPASGEILLKSLTN